ncbi:FABP family protein [Isoptericola sp. b441]|uniref:Ferric nitrobindin-like protein n=1 Tax=Actinotalea lenta TaxID=3064654 RepID=A0ABT9DBW6_9CELL|nr:FABP family protein [Isoptericola sp. b441]MDO8106437.1 FABP family protein [Isoptericola sp. b441]
MPFVIPEGLAPEVYPLAWLVGRWRGTGEVSYPQVPRVEVTGQVEVDHDGGPYLTWRSTLTLAGSDRVWGTEQGFWRVPADRPDDLGEGQFPVELMLTDPAGYLTLYAGVVAGGRIDLASDLMARTPDAAELTAATRLLGLVDGELMWTWDIAAFGEPLQSYAALRMERLA